MDRSLGSWMRPFLICVICGGGHWDDFQASAKIFWSGKLVFTVTESPGNSICLDFRANSGGLLPRSVCVLTGSVASFVVAGTVLLSLRRDIVLLMKSCFIPLSLMNSVPPIAGLWSLLHTKAWKVSGVLFL